MVGPGLVPTAVARHDFIAVRIGAVLGTYGRTRVLLCVFAQVCRTSASRANQCSRFGHDAGTPPEVVAGLFAVLCAFNGPSSKLVLVDAVGAADTETETPVACRRTSGPIDSCATNSAETLDA